MEEGNPLGHWGSGTKLFLNIYLCQDFKMHHCTPDTLVGMHIHVHSTSCIIMRCNRLEFCLCAVHVHIALSCSFNTLPSIYLPLPASPLSASPSLPHPSLSPLPDSHPPCLTQEPVSLTHQLLAAVDEGDVGKVKRLAQSASSAINGTNKVIQSLSYKPFCVSTGWIHVYTLYMYMVYTCLDTLF